VQKTSDWLPDPLDPLWDDYVSSEEDRIAPVSKSKLSEFIMAAKVAGLSRIKDWAFALLAQIVDAESGFPIRMPLFEQILFPILFEGYQNQEKGCARWLEGLFLLLYHSEVAKSSLGKTETRKTLLKRALKDDPSDPLAKKRLVKEIASDFEYALHELPGGVLLGSHGSPIEQCEILRTELEEFRSLVESLGCQSDYEELMDSCEIHFTAYPVYLTQLEMHESYADFLEKSNLPME